MTSDNSRTREADNRAQVGVGDVLTPLRRGQVLFQDTDNEFMGFVMGQAADEIERLRGELRRHSEDSLCQLAAYDERGREID